MRLTITTNVSVDGVMQGLGGPEEDRRDGFTRGGWALPLFDAEVEELLGRVYQRADAFLFGRWTFEVFAGSWGQVADAGTSLIADALNSRPKYVVSTALAEPGWAGTTVLPDVEAIRALRDAPGGELQVHGSLSLARWLLDNQLADEITLFTYPVVIGQGMRLFPADGADAALELVESRAAANGVTVQVYRPAGRPRYAH
ncbi:dihydrofolate reductase family protein [Actinokineospora guangxiensis]|uniref:Dihydrofolate reductase family protein n=1 Tax=Actinokineospora guangxiensis TaxID=1490288 RepID=A0ABW0EY49_9PSEU